MKVFSKEHAEFSTAVQVQAGRCVGDMRSLFPKRWTSAASPLLAAFASFQEHHLITGGLLRFLGSQESKVGLIHVSRNCMTKCLLTAVFLSCVQLRDCETSGEENSGAEELLLPIARGLTSNWETCNRREAGAALAHIVGSGSNAHNYVLGMSRVFKKVRKLFNWVSSVCVSPANTIFCCCSDRPRPLAGSPDGLPLSDV